MFFKHIFGFITVFPYIISSILFAFKGNSTVHLFPLVSGLRFLYKLVRQWHRVVNLTGEITPRSSRLNRHAWHTAEPRAVREKVEKVERTRPPGSAYGREGEKGSEGKDGERESGVPCPRRAGAQRDSRSGPRGLPSPLGHLSLAFSKIHSGSRTRGEAESAAGKRSGSLPANSKVPRDKRYSASKPNRNSITHRIAAKNTTAWKANPERHQETAPAIGGGGNRRWDRVI